MSPSNINLAAALHDLVIRYLPIEETADVDPNACLADLGLSSVDAVDLLFAIEERIGVLFPESLIRPETFATLNSLYYAVESLGPLRRSKLP